MSRYKSHRSNPDGFATTIPDGHPNRGGSATADSPKHAGAARSRTSANGGSNGCADGHVPTDPPAHLSVAARTGGSSAMIRRRRLVGLLAIVMALVGVRVAPGYAEVPDRGPEQGRYDEVPSSCRLTVRSTISKKLTCPGLSVEVRYAMSAVCDHGSSTTVRSLRLASPIPAGITPYDPGIRADTGEEPEPVWQFEHDGPVDGEVVAAYRVIASDPGEYQIGAASVVLVDSEGGTLAQAAASHALIVSDECTSSYEVRDHTAYLPFVERPGCAISTKPADIVVLVDRSSSVGDGGLTPPIQHARDLIDAIALSRDRAAIIAFDQRAERLIGFDGDRGALSRVLQEILRRGPKPGTRIERALVSARRLLDDESREGRRKIVVLITDGVQLGPGGKAPVREAARTLRDSGARILSLGIGPSPDMDLLSAISGPERTIRDLGGTERVGIRLGGAGDRLALAAACTG